MDAAGQEVLSHEITRPFSALWCLGSRCSRREFTNNIYANIIWVMAIAEVAIIFTTMI